VREPLYRTAVAPPLRPGLRLFPAAPPVQCYPSPCLWPHAVARAAPPPRALYRPPAATLSIHYHSVLRGLSSISISNHTLKTTTRSPVNPEGPLTSTKGYFSSSIRTTDSYPIAGRCMKRTRARRILRFDVNAFLQ